MLFEHRIDRNGPCVRILIADHPAQWGELDREIGEALDEGITSAVVLVPEMMEGAELRRVEDLVQRLAMAGVTVVEEWRDGVSAGDAVSAIAVPPTID
jgi:hypothetical protein